MAKTEQEHKADESTVDDPLEQREDDTAKERSTSPVPRVGDTWEDMTDHGTNGPQRRVGVVQIEGDDVLVVNKSTRRHSHIQLESFAPPKWRFIG